MTTLPGFHAPELAHAVETLTPHEIDELPFGVMHLTSQGIVTVYNRTRAEQSGRGTMPTVGLLYYADVAPCLDNGHFRGRIAKGRKRGTLDISFTFIGDFMDRDRILNVRAQTATDGGTWIFIQVPDQE